MSDRDDDSYSIDSAYLDDDLGEDRETMGVKVVDHSRRLPSRLLAQVDTETCDVTFKLGPPRPKGRAAREREEGDDPMQKREFRCHKVLFASCSDYFKALLYGPLQEAKTNIVELLDVPADTFEQIIEYVYTGCMRIGPSDVMDALSIAHRFALPDLVGACTSFLDHHISTDDVCRILLAADFYGREQLEARCWEIICGNAHVVLAGEGFLELTPALLASLVSRADLQVDEIDVFAALQRWAAVDPSTRREALSIVTPHLRLPLIALRDLMRIVRPSGLVSPEQLLDAIEYHADPVDWRGEPSQVRPRGRQLCWDTSSLDAGVWITDVDQTVTSSVNDWVVVHGDSVITVGHHRWSVRINSVGGGQHPWKAVIGVAKQGSKDPSAPYQPLWGLIVGTGGRKKGGASTIEDFSSDPCRDGDLISIIYSALDGSLKFLKNGIKIGTAYTGITPPVIAALAINAQGAMYTLDCTE